MPYHWITEPNAPTEVMHLKPHESLPVRGMAAFVLATFTLILIPAFALLGTPLLWILLPFLLLSVWGIYFALQRNHKQLQITEVLTLTQDTAQLVRTNPNCDTQTWDCNRYWAQVTKYDSEGPVPHYITLKGKGREVEIGAFLSEEERIALYDDLVRAFKS
ncbi:DUF2244 domain-containing protein [Tateyamaria sp.]|uniref:DUF2244 domain-containing protein n=1 Tax=Tateyamaria sp. TaxID=1929288 RepID=UPI0039B93491